MARNAIDRAVFKGEEMEVVGSNPTLEFFNVNSAYNSSKNFPLISLRLFRCYFLSLLFKLHALNLVS